MSEYSIFFNGCNIFFWFKVWIVWENHNLNLQHHNSGEQTILNARVLHRYITATKVWWEKCSIMTVELTLSDDGTTENTAAAKTRSFEIKDKLFKEY